MLRSYLCNDNQAISNGYFSGLKPYFPRLSVIVLELRKSNYQKKDMICEQQGAWRTELCDDALEYSYRRGFVSRTPFRATVMMEIRKKCFRAPRFE